MSSQRRPAGITGLSLFFACGAVVSFTAGLALLFPGSVLEPMWRLNPRAKEAFDSMGGWAVLLMSAVSTTCSLSAVGLWRGAKWGHRLSFGVLVVNLIGDSLNVVLGTEPRAAIGIPIAGALLAFLATERVRLYFNETATS
jgi:hypothetical protein